MIDFDAGKKHRLYVGGISVVAILISVIRYVSTVLVGRNQTIDEDAYAVWKPTAEFVLQGGTFYPIDPITNKPPGFQYVNLAVTMTNRYELVFIVLIGVVNASICYLLYMIGKHYRDERLGVLAALLFVTLLPHVGTHIDARNFALLGVLGAVVVSGPLRRGILLALGGLMHQYTIFAVPALVLFGLRNDPEYAREWFPRFIGAGLVVVGVAYVSIAVLFGYPSFVNAVLITSGINGAVHSTGNYITAGAGHGSALWANPVRWAKGMWWNGSLILPVVLPAGFGVVRSISDRRWNEHWLPYLVLLVGMSIPLLIRPWRQYWILFIPVGSLFAALAILDVTDGTEVGLSSD